MVTRGKILAKEVENAFEGNEDMLMRKTERSDERGKNPSVSSERGFSATSSIYLKSFFLVRTSKKKSARKPNVFTDTSSRTICHSGHDKSTASWKTDNRCPL